MRFAALVLGFLAVSAPAMATPEIIAWADVNRDGDQWTVEYRLEEKAPVWAFTRSDVPRVKRESWRLRSMEVLTPGVSLKRVGHYDVLVAAKGNVPKKVRLRFKPFTEDIETSYDAALAFTDGSVALYNQQFKLVPMRSLAEAESAPIDSGELPLAIHPTYISFRDKAGPVLAQGTRKPFAITRDDDAYVLFGRANPVTGAALTSVIDPGLPKWLSNYMLATMPGILAGYAAKMGPPPVGQPMLMASWAGPTSGVTSMGGSVLPGTVVMTFEGEGVTQPNPAIENGVRWFVAHEGAHFWLGQKVMYSTPRESWITEGGADLLAIRAVAAADSGYDARKRLGEARDECLPLLAKGGVASANERGDHRTYYACGAIIALAAEQASGGDFAGFVKALIERHGGDNIVTRAEWLSLLEERAPGTSAEVSALLDGPIADVPASLDRFIAKTGIAHLLPAGTTP
ncbi:hypothetical protein LZ496_10115 [Sphingomonas sp. NSE70-1]|uniref:Peptidase M1 membrane alanine aminopeptidase domain-containing protein n=1 Tax=Sphingomonas caseinilyticus TaxID=2908205 RepID=A0ABT0RW05_9SPHN|nr:hypothetical protein [Sphingomonas caseinilyticus]MCL6699131.1 hypothetical protein [Sphingomonas caseinilyticus]